MRKPQVEHLRNDITLTSVPPQGSIMYHLISIMFILMSRTELLCRDLPEPHGSARCSGAGDGGFSRYVTGRLVAMLEPLVAAIERLHRETSDTLLSAKSFIFCQFRIIETLFRHYDIYIFI